MPRELLPNCRSHELIDFWHGGFRFTGGVGRYEDGRLAEIFLDVSAKSGTAVAAAARDAAVLASLGLQNGVSPESIRKAITRDEADKAAGPVGHLLDLIAGYDGGGR